MALPPNTPEGRAAVAAAFDRLMKGGKAAYIPMPFHTWSIYDKFLGVPFLEPLPGLPLAPGLWGCGGSCRDFVVGQSRVARGTLANDTCL